MTSTIPDTAAADHQSGLSPHQLPRHIAVIMDGNGRWARGRGLPRLAGHRAGAESVRNVVTECAGLGLDALTLYSFSSENWKRPEEEIHGLMELCQEYLISQRQEMVDNNIRFRRIGRREGLPNAVLDQLSRTEVATAECTGLTLVVALNYGSRDEIVDAVRQIVSEAQAGAIEQSEIDETTISDHLYTAGLPDPDLLIRTAGEMRVSNYLLWQISYAEIHVTETLWPDFAVANLHEAIRDYASRNRRYGGLEEEDSDG